jgi:hypothetical protein
VVEAKEVQNKGLSMTLETQEREFLLMEQAQQVIDQLQNDPDLV